MTNQTILNLAAWAARILPNWAKRGIYRMRPLARLVRGELNRAAPAGLGKVTIAAGAAQGLQIVLDLQTEKDYWLGTYEPELQAALKELVQPGMVAYDVGANIGYISLILARLVGREGQVFAFEALPDNIKRLEQNLKLNGLALDLSQEELAVDTGAPMIGQAAGAGEELAKAAVVRAAVVDRSAPVDFLVGPSGGMGKAQGSAGRQDVAYQESLQVDGLALDDFVYGQGHPAPAVVKMDIEGGEVMALPGMLRLLAEARPLIFMELHGPEAAQAAWTSLQNAGYRICQMKTGFPVVSGLAELDWKAYLAAFPE